MALVPDTDFMLVWGKWQIGFDEPLKRESCCRRGHRSEGG
jgi:hypothetical protein